MWFCRFWLDWNNLENLENLEREIKVLEGTSWFKCSEFFFAFQKKKSALLVLDKWFVFQNWLTIKALLNFQKLATSNLFKETSSKPFLSVYPFHRFLLLPPAKKKENFPTPLNLKWFFILFPRHRTLAARFRKTASPITIQQWNNNGAAAVFLRMCPGLMMFKVYQKGHLPPFFCASFSPNYET